MSKSVLLQTALRLPTPDVEALIQGRMIAAMPRKLINSGQQFALYPTNTSINLLPLKQYYRSIFLPIAQTAIAKINSQGVLLQPKQMSLLAEEEQLQLPLLASEQVLIKAWAKCELCQMLDEPESFEALSRLTVWTTEALQQTLSQQRLIFLAHLRVYLLPQPFEVPVHTQNRLFVPLPQQLIVSEATPVLSDRIFTQRRRQLERLEPPLHPELEELQGAIAQFAATNPVAKQLDQDIKQFLGWSQGIPTTQPDPDLKDWICKIADVGNSSDGYTFEKLVRKSFIKLGFSNSNPNLKDSLKDRLDPEKVGGAGGLDFYCEKPYPVVGECKASGKENVPNSVTAQLINLGHTHLGKAEFDRAIKLIVAAGSLTIPALNAAIENQMNAIRPETLQRLVELKAKYEGAIDLYKLKRCLQQAPFGLADDKVNSAIDKISRDIELRSQIVEAVKQLGESGSKYQTVEIRAHYNAVFAKEPTFKLDDQKVHDLLVELSSPLTGYLGRIKGRDGSDRFYFLRELKVDS